MCDDDDCDELRLLEASNFNQENDENGNSPTTKDFSFFVLTFCLSFSSPANVSSLITADYF